MSLAGTVDISRYAIVFSGLLSRPVAVVALMTRFSWKSSANGDNGDRVPW